MTTPSSRRVIIVVQAGRQLQGLIVYTVSNIVIIDRREIQPPSGCGSDRVRDVVEGIVTLGDRIVMVFAWIDSEQ